MAKGKRRFVQVESDFYRHRKTLKLRRLIGDAAFWIPPRLWAYCIDRDSDDLSDFDADDIAAVLEYQGDAAALHDALISSGFLSPDGKTVTGWKERYRDLFDRYAERARKAAGARWAAAAFPDNQTTGEQIRGDKISEHQQACSQDASSMLQASDTTPEIPPALDTHEFRAAWADWLGYRRERKLPTYKPRSLAAQLNELAEWGHDAAIASIRESIRQQWQGLFPPKSGSAAPKTGGPVPWQRKTHQIDHSKGF